MDFMQIMGVVMFYLRYNTVRTPIAFILFFVTRQIVQNVFLMGRPQGFLWSNPGIPSITVPYHDTNDFFFSGHVGSSMLYLHEFYAQGSSLWILCLCILINMWFLLTVLRTHYIIDLVCGLMFAHLSIILAEKLTYFGDVLLLGLDGKKRK